MIKLLDKFVRGMVASCMVLMVLVVTWQVVSRYALADPSPWTEEVARMLLIWVGLLGGVYAYREKAHLGLDLLHQKVGKIGKLRLQMISDVCCGLFGVAVLIIGGGALVQLTWELQQKTAALGIPVAWVYSVLPLSGLLVLIYSLISLLENKQEAEL